MKIGALDVGTNTVLMLVAETTADGGARRVIDLARITRLGQGVDHNHRLDPAAALRTLDTIAEFVEQARAAGAEKIVTAGTATLRDAADGESLIRRVRERTGVELEIVSGETEAWLSYLAVMRGLRLDPSQRLLIIDIGGGSTEFIRAVAVQPSSSAPVRRQAADGEPANRLGPPHRANHPSRSPNDARSRRSPPGYRCRTHGAGMEVRNRPAGRNRGHRDHGLRDRAEMETYDPDRVHGYRLSREEVERVLGCSARCRWRERRKLKGLDPARADVIFAGTAILERVMSEADVNSVTVSDQGVRWGLVWRELGALAQPPPKPS